MIGELSQTKGYVAICLGGRWGKVCGDGIFWRPDVGQREAVVVCRQLGLSTNGIFKDMHALLLYIIAAKPNYHDIMIIIADPYSFYNHLLHSFYGLPFVISNVRCTSNET